MSKHQIFALAILLSMTCIIIQAVQTGAAASSRQSARMSSGHNVTGEVIRVDTQNRTMVLKSGGATVSLDISNPVLQGYASLSAIKKGDRVGTSYTANGIRITKLPKSAGKEGSETASVEKTIPGAKKPKKSLPFARRSNSDSKSFASVDNNKDGKISPIELSVIIPNLTMDQFRQYDKNHDGYLDRSEFEQITLP